MITVGNGKIDFQENEGMPLLHGALQCGMNRCQHR